jgi:type I restriction enzyme S subunit
MNRIEKLIQQLCPQGVPYIDLAEVAKIVKGTQVNKETLNDSFAYPVYNGGIFPSGRHTEFNFPADTITVSQGGASAGFVNFVREPLWVGAHCYALWPSKIVLNRWLFFVLKNAQTSLQDKKVGAGIPALDRKTLATLKIPVPPMNVQQEIVAILDMFTQLEAELEAELDSRDNQFSFYCNQLFSESYNESLSIPLRTLGELGKFQKGSGLQKSDFANEGDPCVHYGQIHTRFGSRTAEALTLAPAAVIGKLRVANPGDLIIADTAEDFAGVAKATAWLGDKPVAVGGHILIFSHSFDPMFISYFFRSANFQDQKNRLAKGVKVKDISSTAISKIRVPVPDMETQRQIARALGELDDLVSASPAGLLGEIQARRKQYEYYRNKLLTFKEFDAA